MVEPNRWHIEKVFHILCKQRISMNKQIMPYFFLTSFIIFSLVGNIGSLPDQNSLVSKIDAFAESSGNNNQNGTHEDHIQKGQEQQDAKQPHSGNASAIVYHYDFLTTLKTIINESNGQVKLKMDELKGKGIVIPADANYSYSNGLVEYNGALKALSGGDFETAKIHAFKAMPLFRNATLIMNQEMENHDNSTNDKTDEINTLVDSIIHSKNQADELRSLAIKNNVTINFTDYNNVINTTKELLAAGNLVGAQEQFTTAAGLLDNLDNQLQTLVDSYRAEKVKEYVTNTIEEINKLIDHAKELGLPQSTILQLQTSIENLHHAKSIEDLINATDQYSYLQSAIDIYNKGRIEHFDKEYINIQNRIIALESNATKMGIHLQGIIDISNLLTDIKQKIASGQISETVDEIDQIDYLINDMQDILNGVLSTFHDINDTRNLITSLEAEVHQQNNTVVINQIPIAIVLLDYAHSIVINNTTWFYLDTANEAVSHAKNILNDVSDAIDNTKEKANSIMNDISQLEDQANSLNDTAKQQNNTKALAEIHTALELSSDAKNLVLKWNLSDAQNKLTDAHTHLDKANNLIEQGTSAEIKARADLLSARASILIVNATTQKNIPAISLIHNATLSIIDSRGLIEKGQYDTASQDLDNALYQLDTAEGLIDEVNQIMAQIDDQTNQTKTLESDAKDQNNTNALAEINQARSLIKEAISTVLQGNTEKAKSFLDQIQTHLDNASQYITNGAVVPQQQNETTPQQQKKK